MTRIIRITGFVFLALSILVLLFEKYPTNWIFHSIILEMYPHLCATFIDIAITILLIDYLYEIKEKEILKKRLIREIGCEDKGFTSRAVKELKETKWLYDGSLKNCDLSHANLSGLDLSMANLEGVTLKFANLKSTILKQANLKNAKIDKTDFSEANLDNTDFSNATIHNSIFFKASLNKIISNKTDFLRSNFTQAEMREISFMETLLEDTNLSFADLSKSEFTQAKLLRADVRGVNFTAVIVTRCDLNELLNWEEIGRLTSASFSGNINAPIGFHTIIENR